MLTVSPIGKSALILTLAIVILASITTLQMVQAQQAVRVKEFKLVVDSYGFNSTRGGPDLVVNQGDTVRIILTSVDQRNHDFVLDANSPSPYNVKSNRIETPQTDRVEFVANSAGTFKYYCSVMAFGLPSHRERGAEGTFMVNAVAAVQPAPAPAPAPAVPAPPPAQPQPDPLPAPVPAPPPQKPAPEPAPPQAPQQPAPAPAPAPQPQQPAQAPVPAPQRPAPSPAPTTETSSGVDLTTITGVVAVLVVAGLTVALMKRRKS